MEGRVVVWRVGRLAREEEHPALSRGSVASFGFAPGIGRQHGLRGLLWRRRIERDVLVVSAVAEEHLRGHQEVVGGLAVRMLVECLGLELKEAQGEVRVSL